MRSLMTSLRSSLFALGNALTPSPSGRAIFLCGNGRSGTSWIGETLAQAENVQYYREPCHPGPNGVRGEEEDAIWGSYVAPNGAHPYFERILDHVFKGQYWPEIYGVSAFPKRLLRRPRVLVKEVASYSSLEWVLARWPVQPVIVIRHPGAYLASVERLEQQTAEIARYRILKSHPALRDGVLQGLGAHLDKIDDVLGAMTASWAIRNRIVLMSPSLPEDMIFATYETIAEDPVAGFRNLYAKLDLGWNETIAEWIRKKTTTSAEGHYTTARISSERIHAWKAQISPEDQTRIRQILEPFDLPIYNTASDWV